MTQPPQWGAPQPYPQPVWTPPMPPPLLMVALLHWVFAVATCALAAFVAVGRTLSEESLFWGGSYGLVTALFGSLNVPAALAINDPRFPSVAQSRWASFVTLTVFGNVLVRSVTHGDAKTVPSLAVAAIMVLCVLNLFLTTRPRVRQWIAAKRR